MYKVVVATSVGRTPDGIYFNLFQSRWSWTSGYYHSDTYYPYEQAYLTSLLKKEWPGEQVIMVDGNYWGWKPEKYARELVKLNPKWLVMEVSNLTYKFDLQIALAVKQQCGTRIVFAGPYPTAFPEDVIAAGVDYIAQGEFEASVLELVKNGDPAGVPGIFPNPRRPLLDIDSLPWPEDDDISRRDYCRIFGAEAREVEVYATRGCASHCKFCVARNLYYARPSYRKRSVDRIIEEIKGLLKKYPEINGIFFDEESHVLDKKFNLQLCNAIIDGGLAHVKYEAMTNYACLDREILEALRAAGYYKLRIGIETFDDTVADNIFSTQSKKDHQKLDSVLHLCRDLGMKVYATITIGTLGSTREKDLKTLSYLKECIEAGLIQDFQISISTPMPGTPYYNEVVQDGYLAESDGCAYDGNCTAVVSYPWYPREAIEEVFGRGHALMRSTLKANMAKGTYYCMYDRDWCRKVYETTVINQAEDARERDAAANA